MHSNPLDGGHNYLRTALFVDFDNVYLQLAAEDEGVAARFAEQPDRWLRWLETYGAEAYLQRYLEGLDGKPRRILLRRAYLNPRSFHRFRAPFIRFGFEVIDCPPLTTGGKTSTDIYMVMDIMDAIAHSTRFDEFILMSSDADFTPVIARLRKHDRFTLVVSLGQAAAAYRAACDHLVEQDEFIELGMGIVEETPSRHEGRPSSEIARSKRDVLARIAEALVQVIDGTGPIPANELPTIYKRFSEFTSGENWLGFGSLRALTEALVETHDALILDEDPDPWEVRFPDRGAFVANGTTNGSALPRRSEVGEYIQKVVREADSPIDLARLAQLVSQRFGDAVRNYGWQGAGSFKGYLAKLPLGPVAISSVTPGLAYDPERHELPDITDTPQRYEEEFEKQYPRIAELARKVHYMTDMPYLMPEVYAVMLKEIAEEVNDHGYHMVETSKSVRDSCNGKGIPVARSHVTFVLRGLTKAGHRFQENGDERAQQLGRMLVENTFNLCEQAELDLDEGDRGLVRAWILSALPGS
jgi:hypothetical protein